MIQTQSILNAADNSGAKTLASCRTSFFLSVIKDVN